MARPKGVIQKRNESKYILPNGVKLVEGQDPNYRKDTKLKFIDEIYGEFVSDFKSLMLANASTHYKAVSERRKITNIKVYGVENIGQVTREKAQNTMLKKYGVKNALENPELYKKSRETLFKNHGVNNLGCEKFIKKQKATCLEKYGFENAMQSPEIWKKQQKNTIDNGNAFESLGEREVNDFIQSLGLTTRKAYYTNNGNKLEIDIIINELPISIEYNGNYWHSEASPRITPQYHLDKTNYMKSLNNRLIHIFEFEWKNRKKQVKSFLRSALGKNQNIIYARKCIVKEVDKKEAREFLETYHILGVCGFKKAFGIYYNNELLSMITIGLHHRNSKEYVLSRFVGKENYNVIGGLSKLTKAAIKEFGELTTWIDLRWSDGNNWLKSGWKFVHQLKPDYFYWDNKNGVVVAKQSRQKKIVNTPKNMTEHEHALKDKLYRIHDCGKLKLIFKG